MFGEGIMLKSKCSANLLKSVLFSGKAVEARARTTRISWAPVGVRK